MQKARTPVPGLVSLAARNPFFEGGSLRANITWEQPDGRFFISMPKKSLFAVIEYATCMLYVICYSGIKKVLVFWSPEVCIADGTIGNSLARPNFGIAEVCRQHLTDLLQVQIQPT